jgi:hypothetical protein
MAFYQCRLEFDCGNTKIEGGITIYIYGLSSVA